MPAALPPVPALLLPATPAQLVKLRLLPLRAEHGNRDELRSLHLRSRHRLAPIEGGRVGDRLGWAHVGGVAGTGWRRVDEGPAAVNAREVRLGRNGPVGLRRAGEEVNNQSVILGKAMT